MFFTIIFSAILAFELLLCLIVYYASLGHRSDTQKKLRRRFYLFNISIAFWSLSQIAYSWSSSAVFWDFVFRSGAIVIVSVSITYFLFAKSLTGEKANKFVTIIYGLSSFLAIITSIFFDIGKIVTEQGILVIKINPLLDGLVTLSPLIIVAHGIFTLEKFSWKNKKNDKMISKQARFVSRGMLFTLAIILVVNYLLASFGVNNDIADIVAAAAPLVFVIIIAFSVFSLKLFNFSSFLYKSIAYIATLVTIFALYTVVAIIVAQLILGIRLDTKTEIVLAIFSAITALAFQPLKRFFDRLTNHLFYRDAYDSQGFINDVNSALVGEIDLYKLLNNAAIAVQKNLRVDFCNFYLDKDTTLDFHVAGTNVKVFDNQNWEHIVKKISTSRQKIISEASDDAEVSKLLVDLKIGAVVKMTSQNQGVGYLITGQKLSGSVYTSQDLEIIEIIADEVAIAVQNTLRFEEIAQFNATLQKRIKDATGQLQRTNEKLVALDEAKDEFISIASHQLRTPLTSVKGYISMLLEGDAGHITNQQKKFLDQAFISSQRMVYLISDLLNVSRLKTGKFVIEAQASYLPDVVEEELAQLTDTAKARGLELAYSKPSSFPKLNIDETKVRQVIMNFADNAIYYTPSGGKIVVELKADKNNVTYTVTDNGIGVPKPDQHKLFTKFYRAGNARKARPDGTGLGLFMAKKVIVAQGGSIIFETQEGKGSTFGFSFPRAKLEMEPTDHK